jgi:chromate reductase
VAAAVYGVSTTLLDWTVGSGDLYRKPVAWITVAAEGRGGGASADLAKVLRYVDAAVIEPDCVRLPVPRTAIGPDGTVDDPYLRDRLAQILRTITDHAGRIPKETDPKES